ncbi:MULTISPECIES: LLM class flavin-dependent oxidoreductase [unclassified Microbacterium]|uniref:LLM class flavin-dependent oxidoreductase n=1 Tax=unclassified Microbacterium TaxID=2609290 RepID=UPI00214A9F1E|nr:MULTISPECIES: LLM class flavin-dependent oxidoreductase [unclassified Microbacterium]MCR2809093.1 LLM class flavin-dependent oxidoreductase [Microbacterium sp. zg.B185]WIM20248.1 LLM class flavin-dependent oxidoreductase [Microbacterium sp. zg-B185]
MDYGHAVEFGVFITPTNAQPQAPVALAQLSEQLGFDLVTFQDHPYQPRFLDTWTLLSYTAAATSTIRLAPNVLNLPLRPPAVVARAAASLDLLSGGRFELGLGAGAFWDAIEAMGVPRLTPGQAVEALEEAIDLIRGIWNPDQRGPLPSGERYPLGGAKRGPSPAHEIPIWIGALKPRMLRLTGRKADGWLPSLGYLQPAEIGAQHERIDDAARGAGRNPAEVRRLLNVPSSTDSGQLADLALTHGFSTFIVATDDPNALTHFAQETIPTVRGLIEAERVRRGTVAPGRSTRALAARREGISYDEVPASLRGKTIEPGDFAYRAVRSTYLRGGAPGIVFRPDDTAGVQDAVAFARAHRHLPLGIRSGGHGVSGRSTNDGGIVIDLAGLREIEVLDEARRLVRVGPGARWQDVARALEPHGWAITSGDYGGVGVGGLATAGGIGFLGREHGLTIDQLVAAEVVLADGALVRASADQNPELFWAVRGAGANVGIVVSFEFRATPIGKVAWVQLVFDASDAASLLHRYAHATEDAPRDTTLFLIAGAARPATAPVARLYGVIDSEDTSVIIERLQPFLTIAPLLDQSVQLGSYADVITNAPDTSHDGRGEPGFRSGLLDELGPETAAVAAELVLSGSTPWFQLRPVGGAIADVPEQATAYAHRRARYSVTAVGRSASFDELWTRLEERFDGLYLSFESRTGPDIVARAFPPATLERLLTLKEQLDPEGLFRDNFPVR